MERIQNERLHAAYYKKTLSNGLTVLVYPMPDKNSVFALYGANAGSVDRAFSLDKVEYLAPAGTAHFLEHKLFESEKGDAFTLFAKTGASANAFTSFDKTCYLFSASFAELESLEILLSFVNEPHFTEQTVQKEQGIIGQEIKMYLDSPDWKLLFSLLGMLYKKHPVRDDIAGSVESIAEITPQMLYKCCEAYYRPQNMALAVAGNIEPEKVFELCERMLPKMKSYDSKVEYLDAGEGDEIAASRSECTMPINSPQFCLGFKERPSEPGERERRAVICELLLDLIAGEATDLYRKLYDEGLVNGTFGSECVDGRGFMCNTFSGESKDPDKTAGLIKEEIARLKTNGIDPERFEESRRAYLGDALCDFDSVEETATNLIYAHFRGADVFETLSIIESLGVDELNEALAGMFREDCSALAVVEPIR